MLCILVGINELRREEEAKTRRGEYTKMMRGDQLKIRVIPHLSNDLEEEKPEVVCFHFVSGVLFRLPSHR
jgi:hypothetical protein